MKPTRPPRKSTAATWPARSRSAPTCDASPRHRREARRRPRPRRSSFGPATASASPARSEDMAESFGYMGESLLLAVLFVYLILAAQFESFFEPLAIMLSLPLSIVGMAGMLKLTGRHDQHHVPDRPDHAHGAGDQERHPPGRLRQGPAAAGAWTGARRS